MEFSGKDLRRKKGSHYPSWGLFPSWCQFLYVPVPSLVPFLSPSPLLPPFFLVFRLWKVSSCLQKLILPFLTKANQEGHLHSGWRVSGSKETSVGSLVAHRPSGPPFCGQGPLLLCSGRRAQISNRCCLWSSSCYDQNFYDQRGSASWRTSKLLLTEPTKMVHSDSFLPFQWVTKEEADESEFQIYFTSPQVTRIPWCKSLVCQNVEMLQVLERSPGERAVPCILKRHAKAY